MTTAGSAQKIYIKTYGCQMNVYDSDKIFSLLNAQKPSILTEEPNKADIMIMNTCSIREKAQEKVFSELGRWRKLKSQKPDMLIGVGGCVASQEGDMIFKRAPYVDLVFGPQTLHQLPQLVKQARTTQRQQMDVSFPELAKFDAITPNPQQKVANFLTIMEGCSKFCSFCVVPNTRGQEFSRSFYDILAEADQMVTDGCREITLLGQNVNDYLGKMDQGKEATLAQLIHYLCAIDDLKRIRFTTSHPSAFTDDLITAYEYEAKLCDQLHLPVQSGSNQVLANMKRGYTVERFIDIIHKLRQVRPNISITSDFIVGYPGETDQDFEKTLALVKQIQFDGSYAFSYSARPGTPAALATNQVAESIKKTRLAILQQTLNESQQNFSQQMLNQTFDVLVTGHSKKPPHQLVGRTENNRIVHFEGPNTFIGQIVPICITEVLPNALRGRYHINNAQQ
jgi:tRNA-2-methylthio-N6-dimethylallyladenosine synthase